MFWLRRCYLPKCVIKNYNVIINLKNFYDQPIDSGVKNHYRIIAADLSKQEELDADPKAIQ